MLSVAAGTAAARERVPGHLVEAPALAEVDERAVRLWAVEDAPLALVSGEVDVPTVPQCAAEAGMEAAWLAGAAGAMASPAAAAGATRIEAAAGITLTVTGEDVIGGQDLDGTRLHMAITTAGMKTAIASNVVAVGGPYATISVIRRGGGRPSPRCSWGESSYALRNRVHVTQLLFPQGGDNDRSLRQNSCAHPLALESRG